MTEAEARGAEDTDLAAALASAREQQAAVSDILRVISRSKDLQEVFDVIATSARRFCSAEDVMVALVESDQLVGKAHAGDVGFVVGSAPLDRQLPAAGCVVEGKTIHVRDMQTDTSEHFTSAREIAMRYGIHTVLATPMIHDGKAIGSITLRRTEVRPFTDEQIELVRTFADQAVIAIENVRLFNETKAALEQQTAVAEVLKTISRSSFELQPVLDAVLDNAVRLCGADTGSIVRLEDGQLRPAASVGAQYTDEEAFHKYWSTHAVARDPSTLTGRVLLEERAVAIADMQAEPGYRLSDAPGADPRPNRSALGVPLVREGEVLGVFVLRRFVVRPFGDQDIRLVETFADQAAIAIENVRLFNETKEALDQQTALSDVLRTISRSAFDLDAVLQTIVERAAALVGAEAAAITRRDGDEAVVLAQFGSMLPASQRPGTRIPIVQQTAIGRAILTRKRQYIADAAEDPDLGQSGPRTRLVIPFLRDGTAIGTLGVTHNLPKPIGDREMKMLEAFADQAAIAIENVRLFNETKESLERQTALAEILRVIASSPSDQQPVLDAIALNATRYCGAADALVLLVHGDGIKRVAHHGILPTVANPNVPLVRTAVPGRAILDRRTVQVADITGPEGDEFPTSRLRASELGDRGLLATPLIREGEGIGAILLRRRDTNGFTASQIQLVEAFADQAVIAIENVRLFNETKEALKQRTATSEILRVISETLGDPQPVMQAIVDTVLAVCSADSAGFFRRSGDDLILRAVSGTWRGPRPSDAGPQLPFHGDSIVVSALEEGRYQHVADTSADPRYDAAAQWSRTRLAVPVLRGSETIGVIRVGRAEPGGFTEREIRLVEGFADQAAIAFENARLFNETKEALERQTSISDVLQTIGRSAFDLQPVLDTVVERAVKLCDAREGSISTLEDDVYRTRAYWSATSLPPAYIDFMRQEVRTPDRGSLTGRTALEGRVVHIVDVLEDPEYTATDMQQAAGYRTLLGVPLLRDGRVIGVFALTRSEVRPFTDRQIELVRTFADQAAIAIENTRLFVATKEALEQQTAVGDVLKTISRSAFDLQPVLDIVLNNAVRLAGADIGWMSRVEDKQFMTVAFSTEFPQAVRDELDRQRAQGQLQGPWVPLGAGGGLMGFTLAEARTVHLPDVKADPEFKGSIVARLSQSRTVIGVPMLRDGRSIGGMVLARYEVRPFGEREIELVQTFADQAAIAIENVRLFNGTKEALERQTATADILRVIAASPTEVQPVLDAIADRAMRLCAADGMVIRLLEGNELVVVARAGTLPAREAGQDLRIPLGGDTLTGAAMLERRTIHVADVQTSNEYPRAKEMALRGRHHTIAAVPLLREGRAIGVFSLARQEIKPYSEKELALVATFADQAVIAIENVRLFDETKEALEQQSAISEVLKTISGTVFDLRPTLQTVVENAAKLADADVAWMMQSIDDRSYTWGARYGRTPELEALFGDRGTNNQIIEINRVRPSIMGRVYTESRTVVVQDVDADPALLEASPVVRATKSRSLIGVPVMSDGMVAGAIVLGRLAVRPFAEREVQLVETFADQAAIAIRNVRLFNEIQDKSRQLEVASRHKSEFLANMSHELRTPLNAIIGFSEVLVQGLFGEMNEKQREYLNDVIGSGQHLLSLINDILDLSKIEAGRMELELSTFNVRDALQSGVTIVRERASRHNITLSMAVADDLGPVEADERKVKQIFYNLLSNAVKFTPDGGGVDVTVRRDNGDVRVDVQDNGIGIAEADQARIFEEFQQVGRERSREGTGLGLTLTKRFVELHGGRIWLESAPGQGSTFTFTLPLRQAAPVRA